MADGHASTPPMRTSFLLAGLLGLQLTVIGGVMTIARELGAPALPTDTLWWWLMVAGVVVTILAFVGDRTRS